MTSFASILISRREKVIKASIWALLSCLLVFAFGGCLNAPSNASGRVVIEDDHGMIDIAFSDHDRSIIREYYGSANKANNKPLPPGLAKKGKVPPGHQKQFMRQAQLPQDLQYQRLPNDLEYRLSPLPEGYLRVMIDGSFVLFNEKTRVIFDVIQES
jgi:Ni/Co efflux regulator RcnB